MPDLRKSWDKIAVEYRRRYFISTETVHYGPLCPGEDKLRLIGPIAGKKAIDLGCGGGQNAIALAKSGADVTAIDFSTNQLAEAERLAISSKVNVQFLRRDITDLTGLPDNSFDLALSACAMAFVKDLGGAIAEVARILKDDGKFILSVMHPMQYILDGDQDSMTFNSTFPFRPRLLRWNWEFPQAKARFQHYLRSVADYHNTLVESGLIVTRILEPKPTLQTPHYGFSKEIMREYPYIARHLPITLIFVSIKRQKESPHG